MSLKIIIGAASSGKTETLLKDLTERADRRKDELFYILSPEQASFIMQSEVVKHHPRGATMNIDVVSFNRLASVIFMEVGINVSDILDDTGKTLILRKVVEDCADDLKVYKNKIRMPGFIEEVKSVVTELKQYDIDDNGLFLMKEAADEKGNRLLSAKLDDIRLIYEKFNKEIEDKFTTSEEVLDVFARIIPKSERLKGAHIYLDGYTGFTPIQLKVLESMLKFCADVNVTLTLPEEKIDDNCPEYEMFHLSNETLKKLKEIADRAGVEAEVISTKKENKTIKQAYVYGGVNPTDEVVFTAKEILRLVRHEGYRYRDIAVIASDIEEYYPTIRDIFAEAGISTFIDYKSELSENPGSRFLKAALNLLDSPFVLENLCAYLKTGLTKLTHEEVCMIENYCLEFGIKGFSAFSNEFKKNRKLKGNWFWDLKEINGIRKKINYSFEKFYSATAGGKKAAYIYSKNLLELLETNRVSEKLEEMAEAFEKNGQLELFKEYNQIYELLVNLLEKISRLLGYEELTTKEYLDIISDGLKEIKVGIVPPSLDNLIVGDLTRTRFSNVKAIFMLGVNEGKVPKVTKPAGIFTQKERELLKNNNFDLAPGVLENLYTQRFYLHMLFSKPEERLYLTYAQSSPSGETLEQSDVLETFGDYMPVPNMNESGGEKEKSSETGECLKTAKLEKIEAALDETWKQQALRDAAETLRTFVARAVYKNEANDLDESILRYFAQKEPESLRPIFEGGFYRTRETVIDKDIAAKLYGDSLYGSVSRFEKYSECAYKHFLNYGLRLEKRPEYEVAATDIGSLYHDSLEKYSKKLKENSTTFRDVSDEESHRLVEESVKECLENMESGVFEDTARNRFLAKRISDVTLKTTDVLRKHVKAGAFEPAEFEYEFKSRVNDHIEFNGKIDRVDVYDAGNYYVKIIDYKSGTKKFSFKDIYLGTQLQLVAYMSQELKQEQEKHPDKKVKPGGVYYYLINDKFLDNESKIKDKYRMSGMTLGEPEVVKALDSDIGPEKKSSDIVEVGLDKDGFYTKGNVANEEQFLNLLNFVDEKIKNIGEEIYAGNVETNPILEGQQKSSCTYCEFKDICKFEDGNFGNAFRAAEDLELEDMKSLMFCRPEENQNIKALETDV